MAAYFLGIDIGGTKSHALIADAAGNALGFGVFGPGNHESVGYDGLRRALQAVTEKSLGMAGISREDITAAGFGVAGYVVQSGSAQQVPGCAPVHGQESAQHGTVHQS